MSLAYRYEKLPAEGTKPIQVFQNLKGAKKFLLESTYSHKKKGKFSFLGMNPYQEIIGEGGETKVIDLEAGTVECIKENALHLMKKQLPAIETHLPIPFNGGAVGYVGYDAIRDFLDIGSPLPDELNVPEIHFMLFKNIIAFDHGEGCIYLIAVNPDNSREVDLEKQLQQLKETLANRPTANTDDFSGVEFEPEETEASLKEKILRAKEHIERGEVQQVVLSQRFTADLRGKANFPLSFYQSLREANPSPYMFYIDFAEYIVLGASPESLLQISGKEVSTNPIAGTRPRGRTTEEDAALESELLADEKELAEHRMLVDLSKDDLAKICDTESIHVPIEMVIEKYQHVMHIVSEVKGELQEQATSLDALIACLPAGTVSGAPKQRAMQIINELEEKMRGPYGGGVGYINFNQDLNIALTIRSLIIKNEVAYLQAGAGIVQDSVPEKEYQETLHKARALLEAAYTFS